MVNSTLEYVSGHSVVITEEQIVKEAGREDFGSSFSSAYVWTSSRLLLLVLSSSVKSLWHTSWLTTLVNLAPPWEFTCCVLALKVAFSEVTCPKDKKSSTKNLIAVFILVSYAGTDLQIEKRVVVSQAVSQSECQQCQYLSCPCTQGIVFNFVSAIIR